MSLKNIKLKIEYDGTNYAGWQRQKNAVAIQNVIEDAIKKATGKSSETIGSSRTDAGVHARGYIANFLTESSIPGVKFKDALNVKLPGDIVILDSTEVPLNFHARYDSKGKRYSYTVLNRIQKPAIGRNYVYYFRRHLDIELMKKASKYFMGMHDFSSFKNTGSSAKTSIRTVTQLDIYRKDDIVKFIVSADGFLYNMVRIMVGALLNVGTGKIEPEYIKSILASKDRKKAGKAAPASGLCLEEVFY